MLVRKNSILIVSMLLLALVLAPGGGMKEATAAGSGEPGGEPESEAQKILARNDKDRATDEAINWPTKYHIITETYIAFNDTMDIAIRYPQIIDLGDEERQNRLNELIKKEAIPGQFLNYDDKRLFTLPIDYKITWQSDNLLSIQYFGMGYVKGTPHPNHFFYTTNIDIVQVKKVKLKDIVRIDEGFVEKYRNEDIKTVSPHPGALSGKKILIDSTPFKTAADTIRHFNEADKVDSKGRLEGTYCYFTPYSLGISVDAPHFMGGHAEFEIKYEDIAENIKADNTVWRDFFPRAAEGRDGEAFSRKIEVFRAELSSYHSAQRPNERYDAGNRVNAALLDVLGEEESLTAKPGDILGGDGSFELAFGDWVVTVEKRYRLVILHPFEINMGAMTAVFCQSRAVDKAILAERVHTLTQGASVGYLAYSEIVESGNDFFLPIVEVRHGSEDKYVSVYVRRLENDRWQVYMPSLNGTANGRWTIRNVNTGFSIGHPSMGWNSENDYQVNASRGDTEIRVVDKAKTPIDSIKISFVDGAWVLRQ